MFLILRPLADSVFSPDELDLQERLIVSEIREIAPDDMDPQDQERHIRSDIGESAMANEVPMEASAA